MGAQKGDSIGEGPQNSNLGLVTLNPVLPSPHTWYCFAVNRYR